MSDERKIEDLGQDKSKEDDGEPDVEGHWEDLGQDRQLEDLGLEKQAEDLGLEKKAEDLGN